MPTTCKKKEQWRIYIDYDQLKTNQNEWVFSVDDTKNFTTWPYSGSINDGMMILHFSHLNENPGSNYDYLTHLLIWNIFKNVKGTFPFEIDDSNYVFTDADAYIKLNISLDLLDIAKIIEFKLITYYNFTFYNKNSTSIIKHKDLYSSYSLSFGCLGLTSLGLINPNTNDTLKLSFTSPNHEDSVTYEEHGVTLNGTPINSIGVTNAYNVYFEDIVVPYPNITFAESQ